MSLTSSALAQGFFIASTTWEPQLTEQMQYILSSSSPLPRGQGRTLVYSYREAGSERGLGEPGLSDHILWVPSSFYVPLGKTSLPLFSTESAMS